MRETEIDEHRMAAEARRAAATFYETWLPAVYAYFARRTPDAATAEDLTAAAFERMVGALPAVGDGQAAASTTRAWVYRVAGNVYKNALRESGRRSVRDEAWGASWRPEPGGRAELEMSLTVGQAMAQLPPTDRDLLGLRFWDGLNAVEIAAVHDCTPRAVYTAIERCLRQLKRQLDLSDCRLEGAAMNRLDDTKEARGVRA